MIPAAEREERVEATARRRIVAHPLTAREIEVARLVALTDLTYTQAAERLGITVHTVRAHIQRVFRKLGIRNREDLLVALRALDGAR